MRTQILCGSTEFEIEVPDDAVVLTPYPAPPLPRPQESVIEAITDPIGTVPLALMARGRKNACVVISDVTRPVPNKIILPPILDTLESAGIKRQEIVILIATGMHRPNLGTELEQMVGAEIAANYRIENHYCRKGEDLRKIAEIDGAPIEINKHYLDADLKILTGLIEPHMYAGYSGGRKSILPGISSFKTMTFMHSFEMIDHRNVTNCKLDGNPFHAAGEKVAKVAGVDFIVNVVINKHRELVGVFAGHPVQAHLAGCKMVEQMSVQRLSEPVDLVVTSAGGYPLDATFYQVSKGLIAASGALRQGGAIIIACECREGLGSEEFCELVRQGHSSDDFVAHCRKPENFKIDQWCLQTTYQALAKAARVYLFSPYLDESELGAIGITKIDDLQAAVTMLAPDHPKIAVSPEGPYVVGLIEEKDIDR
ncbi:MAG: nickel-dependent lactate racemase [Desulfobacteraceae bacterium]|jgi:nickel-dependent lactate racemase